MKTIVYRSKVKRLATKEYENIKKSNDNISTTKLLADAFKALKVREEKIKLVNN